MYFHTCSYCFLFFYWYSYITFFLCQRLSVPLLFVLSLLSHVWVAFPLYIYWSTSISRGKKKTQVLPLVVPLFGFILLKLWLQSPGSGLTTARQVPSMATEMKAKTEVRIHWGVLLLGCTDLVTSVPCLFIFHDQLLDACSWGRK